MSEETTQNFWQVMRSFEWPEPKPVSYRLYHDADGRPIIYSMEDLPGAYIEVDPETYAKAPHNVRVEGARLIVLQAKIAVTKLVPDLDLGTPCDTRDVCVVIDEQQAHTKWKKVSDDID